MMIIYSYCIIWYVLKLTVQNYIKKSTPDKEVSFEKTPSPWMMVNYLYHSIFNFITSITKELYRFNTLVLLIHWTVKVLHLTVNRMLHFYS